MLIDPYADPLWDTEPCPERAAEQAAAKNRSLAEIFEATLKSRDHNVLMTALTGMYARLEGAQSWTATRRLRFLSALRVCSCAGHECWLRTCLQNHHVYVCHCHWHAMPMSFFGAC
jgi:hypothetical protein